MRFVPIGIVMGLLLGLSMGCRKQVKYYCDEDTPCLPRYPERPFCDLYGAYDQSGHVGRTCIPNPLDGGTSNVDAGSDIDGQTFADAGSDASISTDAQQTADAQTTPCDPVTQAACAAGEKCTYIIEQTTPTILGQTACAPDGSVAVGGACTRDANGVDDCLKGAYCSGDLCTALCSTSPDSCPTTAKCTPFSALFDDRANVGLCVPQCDPLSPTSCGAGESCYLSPFNGSTTCATPYLDDPEEKTGAATCPANPGT